MHTSTSRGATKKQAKNHESATSTAKKIHALLLEVVVWRFCFGTQRVMDRRRKKLILCRRWAIKTRKCAGKTGT